jgi:hypothetical protein
MPDTTVSLMVETLQLIEGITDRIAHRISGVLQAANVAVISDQSASDYRLHVVANSQALMVDPHDFGKVKYRCTLTIACSPRSGASKWIDPVVADHVEASPDTPFHQTQAQLGVAGMCSAKAAEAILVAIEKKPG